MRIRVLTVATLSCSIFVASCQERAPLAPGAAGTLDQFVKGLQQQGLTVAVAGEIPPDVNGFFSVPARQVRVNESQVNVFEYPGAQAAAAEAALVSPDGQPSPTARITWVSTPHFYRQDRLIVLYVGCSTEIVQALQTTVGPPIAVGRTPCEPER